MESTRRGVVSDHPQARRSLYCVVVIATVCIQLLMLTFVGSCEGREFKQAAGGSFEKEIKLEAYTDNSTNTPMHGPAVKSFQVSDGSWVDCVPIQQQIAAHHPALKDHIIRMETSASSRLNLPKSRRESELHPQCFGREYGGCPEGSIPVQRMSTDPNNPRQKKHRRKQQSPRTRTKHRNTTDPADPSAELPHQYAVVEGAPTLIGGYLGGGATFSVNGPVIADPSYEFSLSQLWLVAGDSSNTNTAEVGWQVYPGLHPSDKPLAPHLFVYWTSDDYQNTGCYNLGCSGFVQTDNTCVLGGAFSPYTTLAENSNVEYKFSIYVVFDPKIPGWVADDGTKQQELSRVVCFGELLVDFVPLVGGLPVFEEPGFKAGAGGAPANVAVGICKLGVPAAFIGKVGDDEFGHALANVLKENGVETRGIRFDSHARTGLAFISLRSDGERTFIFYPSADMLMVPEELDHDLITNAKIFHYGSISLIAEPCRSTHLQAMKIAKEAGVLLSYDPNLCLQLWPSPEETRKEIMSIWSEANIIKVSADEVRFLIATSSTASFASSDATDNNNKVFKVEYEEVELLTSSSDHDAKSWRPNLKLLLVTDGPHGCHYFTPSFKGTVATLKVPVVDTTGAGDAFVAGILTKLVQDISLLEDEKRLQEAVRFANACGAITVTRRGAIPALPDTEAVLNLLREIAITD